MTKRRIGFYNMAYTPLTDFTTAKGVVQTFVEGAAPLYLGFAGLAVAIMIGAKWVKKLRGAA